MRHDFMKNAKLLPANFGPLRDADGHARLTGPCGDTVEIWLRMGEGRIAQASFTTDGCGHSIASGSAAARLAEGKTPEEALRTIGREEVSAAAGGLPEESRHCAILAAAALAEALSDLVGRRGRRGAKRGAEQAPSPAPRRGGPDDEALRRRLKEIRHTVVVLSGKGGVGKSTVAVNLAVALGLAGKRVGLLDIDIHGPSVPGMLRLNDETLRVEDDAIVPAQVGGLKVMSVGFLLQGRDDAVIWRGPMKAGVIRQFLQDVAWGPLDYLIVDSPPGTGDEPLSVCQLVGKGAAALIVTTPQDVAVADVKKSINFCRALGLPVLGVVENMSGFACPGCGLVTPIFKKGGGERMAAETGVPFIGRIPIDLVLGETGDEGRPYVHRHARTEAGGAFIHIVDSILAHFGASETPAPDTPSSISKKEGIMRIAIPLTGGTLSAHFGHCESFALVDADPAEKRILGREDAVPPPHEPGVLPAWLAERGADMIIAGGMGSRAQGLFAAQGIKVLVGAPAEAPEKLVANYLAGCLTTGANVCGH